MLEVWYKEKDLSNCAKAFQPMTVRDWCQYLRARISVKMFSKMKYVKSHSSASRDQDLQLILMTGSTHSEPWLSEMLLLPQKGTLLLSLVDLYYKKTALNYYIMNFTNTKLRGNLSCLLFYKYFIIPFPPFGLLTLNSKIFTLWFFTKNVCWPLP